MLLGSNNTWLQDDVRSKIEWIICFSVEVSTSCEESKENAKIITPHVLWLESMALQCLPLMCSSFMRWLCISSSQQNQASCQSKSLKGPAMTYVTWVVRARTVCSFSFLCVCASAAQDINKVGVIDDPRYNQVAVIKPHGDSVWWILRTLSLKSHVSLLRCCQTGPIFRAGMYTETSWKGIIITSNMRHALQRNSPLWITESHSSHTRAKQEKVQENL